MRSGDVIVLDGGLATELEARGNDLSGALWSARLLRDDPQAIEEVHLAFFRAGADVAITASFQASEMGFARAGVDRVEARRLIARSVELARSAADRIAQEEPDRSRPLVAASVGPYGAALADGSEYRGGYSVDVGELRSFHAERLDWLIAASPDMLAVETIPSGEEAEVLAALLRTRPASRAWVSFQCRDAASLADGTPFSDVVAMVSTVPSVVAVGVNCVDPGLVEPLLVRARRVTDLPLVAYPNDGRVWDAAARAWRGTGRLADADMVRRWRDLGAGYIGGCCGTRPAAIERLAAALRS
ncbi:MAG TPA: homocysteine S-methyltransferase [Gaiellaceae bacterium]|nr:homocysteine S-methyltransferase [Gaiellaceae bacterium]